MAEENALVSAVVKVIGTLKNPSPDAKNAYLKNQYVSLKKLLEIIKPALMKEGLVLVQMVEPGLQSEADRLVTRIWHKSGESFEDGGIPLYCKDRNNPQAIGSCITYARRNGIQNMLALAGDPDADDDAVEAVPEEIIQKQIADQERKSNAKPVEKKAAPKAEPPISQDEKKKLGGVELPTGNAFFDEHFPKLTTHKTISIHERWNKQYEPQINKLKKENPELHTLMGLTFTAHQNDLLNKTEGK